MNYTTDISLDKGYQLQPDTGGEALTCAGQEAFLQDIRMEAITQQGDMWNDPDYGWGLQEFSHAAADELTIAELRQRVSTKLSRRTELDVQSIQVDPQHTNGEITGVTVAFRFVGDDTKYKLDLSIGRVEIEVIQLD